VFTDDNYILLPVSAVIPKADRENVQESLMGSEISIHHIREFIDRISSLFKGKTYILGAVHTCVGSIGDEFHLSPASSQIHVKALIFYLPDIPGVLNVRIIYIGQNPVIVVMLCQSQAAGRVKGQIGLAVSRHA